jgi:hypothetical protein
MTASRLPADTLNIAFLLEGIIAWNAEHSSDRRSRCWELR